MQLRRLSGGVVLARCVFSRDWYGTQSKGGTSARRRTQPPSFLSKGGLVIAFPVSYGSVRLRANYAQSHITRDNHKSLPLEVHVKTSVRICLWYWSKLGLQRLNGAKLDHHAWWYRVSVNSNWGPFALEGNI